MMPTPPHTPTNAAPGRHQVVVIGSGFGGLFATKRLRREPVEVTVIDRSGYHLFQPLLYQVSTGILSEGEIAPATRDILRHQSNANVIRGDVTHIDLHTRTVTSAFAGITSTTPYDSLIVAAGAGQSYFGHDEFAEYAPGMKDIDDALTLRARIFDAFEVAEVEPDPQRRQEWLTFAVIGGGPTGVEMAGQLAELSRRGLSGNYAHFDPADTTVALIEAGPALLPEFGPTLSERTYRDLTRLGVQVHLNTRVVAVDAAGVTGTTADGSTLHLAARTKVWAAGVSASGLGRLLAQATGATLTRTGQITVNPDCSLPGHPEVFVVGDMMRLGQMPGVAQVAIQSGVFAARQITHRLHHRPTDAAFHYRDKGTLATICRFKAIAAIGPLRISGLPAWILWLAVHLVYLVGFRNRVTVLFHWIVTFAGRARSERPATEQNTAWFTAHRADSDPGGEVNAAPPLNLPRTAPPENARVIQTVD